MTLLQTRQTYLETERRKPDGAAGFFGMHVYLQAPQRQRPGPQVLSGIMTGTGAQGRQQQFRRSRSCAVSGILFGLISYDAVGTEKSFEPLPIDIARIAFHVTDLQGWINGSRPRFQPTQIQTCGFSVSFPSLVLKPMRRH